MDVKEDDLRDLFGKYGEIAECFLSSKGFGFLRLDTRAHAEVAKEELDGFLLKGRPIRVRFAVHGTAVKVKGLSNLASNELLHQAFSMFGDVERAVHIVDDQGLILALTYVHGRVIKSNADCDTTKFAQCATTFAKAIGLQSLNKNSTALTDQITQLLKQKGLDGKNKSAVIVKSRGAGTSEHKLNVPAYSSMNLQLQKPKCDNRAGKDLKKCAGDQYDSCMSPGSLESAGVSEADASTFNVLSRQEGYICTTGWDVFSKNWDCISKVYQQSEQALTQCINDFTKKITDDPANLCKYYQEFVDCYDSPFQKSCGPAVTNDLCESMKYLVNVIMPQCSVNCPAA